MNKLITYAFDFRNDELLSYYISFLRFVLNCFSFPFNEVISLRTVFVWVLSAIIFLSSDNYEYVLMIFIRAISGKLNKNTISLLVKTQNVSPACYIFVFNLFLKVLFFSLLICMIRILGKKWFAIAYDFREMLKLPPYLDRSVL